MIADLMRYACAAGLLTWVVCVFVACSLVRADLADMDADKDGEE